MDKNLIIQYLDQPEALNMSDVSKLENFLDSFPHCQTARMLYTKGLHNENNIAFDRELKKTAAYCSDRKVLYELIAGEDQTETRDPGTGTEAAGKEENVEAPRASARSKPDQPETRKDSSKEETAKNELYEQLDRQILTAAISNTILLESEKSEKTEGEKERKEDPETSHTATETTSAKEEDLPAFNESDKHSLSDWLNYFEGKPAEKNKEEVPTELYGQEKNVEKREKEEKVKFFSAPEMAKNSVKEDDNLYTETLAKIYEQQGNIEKAIHAYEKLSLKYPEKRSYFADRINLLKDKLKDK